MGEAEIQQFFESSQELVCHHFRQLIFRIIITIKSGPVDQGLIENILNSDRGEAFLMQKPDETVTDIPFCFDYAKVFLLCHPMPPFRDSSCLCIIIAQKNSEINN